MTSAKRSSVRQPEPPAIIGFGFQPDRSEHYFLVTLPRAKTGDITISEHFEWFKPTEDAPIVVPMSELNTVNAQLRVVLRRTVWDEIAEEIRAELNRRLRMVGLRTAKWPQSGQVPVDRTLGKEVCVLAWAVEDCDPALIPNAIRNWLGLVPEERWWLYMMTNAATGHAVAGRGKGWRKALRYALTENPVSEGLMHQRLAEFELMPSSAIR